MTVCAGSALESEFLSTDGTRLFVRDWLLDDPAARRGVVIMHGLGEHCGRYLPLAGFFNQLGFQVRTYDHRGHGRSGGASGDVPDAQQVFADARQLIEDFSSRLAAPPLLLGHSMGGLFAARFACACMAPLSGLILSSPALALRMNRWQQALLQVATALIPAIGLPNGLSARYLSHDTEVVRAYQQDPLVHPKISARLLNCMLSAITYCQQHPGALKIPVLVMAAEEDHLVDPQGARQFAAALPEQQVMLRSYPGLYHEIFNELDNTQVFDDLRSWLETRQFTPLPGTAD